MYTNKELEEIYDERYSAAESQVNARETVQYRKYRKMLLPKAFVNGDVSNLDLGCGRGHKTVGFTEGFKRVLAVDLSSNVIEHCKKFYKDRSNIEFKATDATVIEEKFNLITAFGFSLFNTSDNDKLLSNLYGFLERNLDTNSQSFVVIGSFTDFSGNGADSWYLHKKSDLEYISDELRKRGYKVEIIFPHKVSANYFGSGFVNFSAEIVKLIKKKKRTFFIVIEHEQN